MQNFKILKFEGDWDKSWAIVFFHRQLLTKYLKKSFLVLRFFETVICQHIVTGFVLQFLICYQNFARLAFASSEHLFNRTLHKNYPLILKQLK